jgi:hypothetical protein
LFPLQSDAQHRLNVVAELARERKNNAALKQQLLVAMRRASEAEARVAEAERMGFKVGEVAHIE